MVKSLFLAALAFGIVGILGRIPIAWVVVLYAVIAFAGSMLGPGLYTIIPLLAALTYFQDSETARTRSLALLAIAAGVLALTYSSSGVLSLALFVLMDLGRSVGAGSRSSFRCLRVRRLPRFILAGQTLSTLPDYVRSSFEIISGYAEAMSVKGHAWELPLYLALGLVAIASVVRCELPSLTDPRRRADSVLLLSALLVYWFITFKSGFVRQRPPHRLVMGRVGHRPRRLCCHPSGRTVPSSRW